MATTTEATPTEEDSTASPPTGKSRIRVLPPDLANQIAAGEVVERPASVVKEMVENALDAGARRITVSIQQGGLSLIRVMDDGCGMTVEEAVLSLKRYATSKLQSIDDLTSISTLGFRGEALPSIASVSRLALVTRPAESNVGLKVEVEGGGPPMTSEVGCAPGTVVEVRDLFFNVPARRKFMRKPGTEAGHVQESMVRLALTHPDVHFVLKADQKGVLDLPVHPDLEGRIGAALGRRAKGGLYPVRSAPGEIEVYAVLAAPEDSVSTARWCYLYVNNRSVRDRILLKALATGYGEALESRRYPVAVVLLTLPPGLVDVNVHPQKHEVRFVREREVASVVRRTVAELVSRGPWSSPAARKYVLKVTAGEEVSSGKPSGYPSGAAEAHIEYPEPSHGTGGAGAGHPPTRRAGSDPAVRVPSRFAGRWLEGSAAGNQPALLRPERLAPLRVVGQVLGTYIILEGPGEIILIDQHAAHERITYNRIASALSRGNVPSQTLLVPMRLELTPLEADAASQGQRELERLGFQLEPFGSGSHALSAVPALLHEAGADPESVLRDVLCGLQEPSEDRNAASLSEDLVARMACHSSVRAGRVLDPAEVEALVTQMDEASSWDRCPHGRPVVIRIPETEIRRRFKRS